jgi:RNA polymerase sigma-70 factor (TIGR02952 family)
MPSAPAHDEADLVRRAREGDTRAFGMLYEYYLDPIYRYIYYRIGSHPDAEDLTEQVFIKAWEALPRYQERGYRLSSWLYRIAHNIVIDHRRRDRAREEVELTEESAGLAELPTPQEQLIQAETMAEVVRAMTTLSDEQQEIIILRFIEGLSYAEVAQIMGKNEGACRALQYRALAALARQVDRT